MEEKYKRKKTALFMDSELMKMGRIYSLCRDMKFTQFLEDSIKNNLPKGFYELYKKDIDKAVKKYKID